LEENDLKMRIEMGDDGKYHVSGEGMVVFQREHGAPLTLTDVKYVPGLKKNPQLQSMSRNVAVIEPLLLDLNGGSDCGNCYRTQWLDLYGGSDRSEWRI